MSRLEHVTITQFRDNLSGYVFEAEQGTRFVIYYLRTPTQPGESKYDAFRHSTRAGLTSEEDVARLHNLQWLYDQSKGDPDLRLALEQEGLPLDVIEKLLNLTVEEIRASLVRARAVARDAKFRRALEEAGVEVSWPTGDPLQPHERAPLIDAGDPPVSEQIIADRR